MSLNIEDKLRIEGVVKSVSRKNSRKKELNPRNWKKNELKRQRHVSKHLPTMTRCSHDQGKKSIFKCNSLNMQILENFTNHFTL